MARVRVDTDARHLTIRSASYSMRPEGAIFPRGPDAGPLARAPILGRVPTNAATSDCIGNPDISVLELKYFRF